MSLLFAEGVAIEPEAESIATFAADLGGQALERAQLYERERESRRAMERILRVAPHFHADTVEAATAAICREARTTFGADLATLWRVRSGTLLLLQSDPQLAGLEVGLETRLDDFPELRELDHASVDLVRRRTYSRKPRGKGSSACGGSGSARRCGRRSESAAPRRISCSSPPGRVSSREPDPSDARARPALHRPGGPRARAGRASPRRGGGAAPRRRDAPAPGDHVQRSRSPRPPPTSARPASITRSTPSAPRRASSCSRTPSAWSWTLSRAAATRRTRSRSWARVRARRRRAVRARDLLRRAGLGARRRGLGGFQGVQPERRLGLGRAARSRRRRACAARCTSRSARPVELGPDERRWLQSIVSQCALALERSRLYDVELELRQPLRAPPGNDGGPLERAHAADVGAVSSRRSARQSPPTAPRSSRSPTSGGRPLRSRRAGTRRTTELAWLDTSPDAANAREPGRAPALDRVLRSQEELASAFPELAARSCGTRGTARSSSSRSSRDAASNALLAVSWAEPHAALVRTSGGSWRRSPARPRRRSTARRASRRSRRSRRRSSAACCRSRCRRSTASTSPRATCPGTAELDVGGDWFDALTAPGRTARARRRRRRREGRASGGDDGAAPERAARLLARAPEAVVGAGRLNRLAERGGRDRVRHRRLRRPRSRWPASRASRRAGHPPPLVAFPGRARGAARGGPRASARRRAGHLVLARRRSSCRREACCCCTRTASSSAATGRSTTAWSSSLDAVRDGPREPGRLVEHVSSGSSGGTERGDDVALLAVRLLTVAPRPLRLRIPEMSRARARARRRASLARGHVADARGLPRGRSRRLGGVRERGRARVGPGRRLRRRPRGESTGSGREAGRGRHRRLEASDRAGGSRARPRTHALDDDLRRRTSRRRTGTRVTLEKISSDRARGCSAHVKRGRARPRIRSSVVSVLEDPDQQQDDENQCEEPSADIHRAPFPRLPRTVIPR